MTIVVSLRAREDLAQAYRRIAEDNPEAADRVLARLVEVIGMLASGAVDTRVLLRLWEGPRRVFLVVRRPPAQSVVAALPPAGVREVGVYGSRCLYGNR